jgi:RNA polymerase sigma factor for flagellar operon FliA
MTDTALWEAYQSDGDLTARDRLVEEHIPLVRYLARKLWKRIHGKLELDDLVSAGTVGLINAVENFEPERGLAFSTFATPRIRGAILDHLRRWDHVPRSVRRKQRSLDQAREELAARLGRAPTRSEIAEELDVDLETVCQWESDAADAVQVALDAPLPGDGKQVTTAEILPGEDGKEPETRINHDQEVAILTDALGELPERERTILALYYHEGLKMHQIAEILGVTESRISQIRSKTIKTLRTRIGHLREVTA